MLRAGLFHRILGVGCKHLTDLDRSKHVPLARVRRRLNDVYICTEPCAGSRLGDGLRGSRDRVDVIPIEHIPSVG